jgi:hypothetical protein
MTVKDAADKVQGLAELCDDIFYKNHVRQLSIILNEFVTTFLIAQQVE